MFLEDPEIFLTNFLRQDLFEAVLFAIAVVVVLQVRAHSKSLS